MAIVVVGNVFVDIKGFPEDLYIPGGRNSGSVQIVHGGVGRNVAEDIGNVELRPVFVSMVDDTAEGAEVLRKLNNHRVNTDYVVSVPDGMGMWLAVFDESGDVVASISKRPNVEAMVRLLDEKGDEIFSNADSIVIEIDLDKEVVKRVL
ncbi:MAG: carbohydrate kinase family protein, partial [Oscillospiraceae bacterium]|nr:carbohydrate kinase family protein [Oscillospiraceae bacterium]